MIRRIEALNYRSLRCVKQEIGAFHVLVGPNASGKSSFLDVLAFLSRLVSDGLDAAVEERSSNFYDLVWGREGSRFELAVEAEIPPSIAELLTLPANARIRYEVAIGVNQATQERGILEEQITVTPPPDALSRMPMKRSPRGHESLFLPVETKGQLFSQYDEDGFVSFSVERQVQLTPGRQTLSYAYRGLDRKKTVFEHVNNEEFPATSWLGDQLAKQVLYVNLSNDVLKEPSPPAKGLLLGGDGSNLPWVVSNFKEKDPKRFQFWLEHVQTGVPDIEDIRVIEKPEDKHRYLMVKFKGGSEVPSWMLSDGTLRLIALTIIPYAFDFRSIFLIEEPENCVYPLNIETVMQSLSAIYDGQVLIATQSPDILNLMKPKDLLVFTRREEQGTSIVRGDMHPRLQDEERRLSIGSLYAGGSLECR